MKNVGVISMGIKAPIVKEGDDLVKIVVDSVLEATKLGVKMIQPAPNVKGLVEVPGEYEYNINNKDVIGITESIVARTQGNYATVDEIAIDVVKKFGPAATITLIKPIYSRNRFSMILKGIARAAKHIIFVMPEFDEVGNPKGVNPFTGVDIQKYYQEICEKENCTCEFTDWDKPGGLYSDNWVYCGLHDYKQWKESHTLLSIDKKRYTLADICSDKNPDYGVLGSNKATEEKIKLFPTKEYAKKIVEEVQKQIAQKTGKIVEVMVYGDGCFHSPSNGKPGSSIWEFADPVVSPAYTSGLDGYPNEIKIKAFADDEFKDLSGDELTNAVKEKIKEKDDNLVGNMASQGTTPRHYTWLLGSLMDLTSGSGDKGTPFVLVQNYFNNYSND